MCMLAGFGVSLLHFPLQPCYVYIRVFTFSCADLELRQRRPSAIRFRMIDNTPIRRGTSASSSLTSGRRCLLSSFSPTARSTFNLDLRKARGYAYPKIEYVKIRTYLSKNTIRVWYVSYTKILFMVYSATHSLRII